MFSISLCLFVSLCIYKVAPEETCVDCDNETELRRNKRIIYGTPLRAFDSYNVVGYYVHISFASGWSWFWLQTRKALTLNMVDIEDKPSPGHFLCGGSLITPSIVQTACHCICRGWTRPPNWGPYYLFPIMKNAWEDMVVLHHGYTKLADFDNGVWSRKFIVHLECKTWNETGFLTHDFGMIMTKRLLPELTYIKTNFAPVYTMRDLAIQYYRTMKREAVCLFIGFGRWNFSNRKKGIYGEPAQELMHGWRTITNYWQCYWFISARSNFLYGKPHDPELPGRYIRDCTWSCHAFFGKHRAITAPGDSGGPVVCGDEYFGLNSFTYGIVGYDNNVSRQALAAVAFNMYENAAEYREAMIKRFFDFADSNKDYPPEVRDLATVDPFDPDAYYHITHPTKRIFGKL